MSKIPKQIQIMMILSICMFFIGTYILCMLNVGRIINGNTDDNIIVVVLIVFCLIISWKISGKIIKEDKYENN